MAPRAASTLAIPLSVLVFASACASEDSRVPAEIPAEELVQSGCSTDTDCPGGRCIAGIGDGLCTANCERQADCPDGTMCTDTEAMDGVCLLTCSASSECAAQLGDAYSCDTESHLTTGDDIRVCIDSR